MRSVPSHSKRRGSSAELNMTPMIDVVFLLIIFFLVSSHLARRETRLQLALPTATTGAASYDDLPRVTINIQADGNMLVGSEPVEPAELVERLRVERDRYGEVLRVRLRGDMTANYALVEPALAACVEAGIEDIGLAVSPIAKTEAPR